MKEVQDKDMCGGKEWGRVGGKTGKELWEERERKEELVKVRWCRARRSSA